MEDNRKTEAQFVTVEFLDEMVENERKYAVQSAVSSIRIYASALSKQAAAMADKILNAQAKQLYTDEEVKAKAGMYTADWDIHDCDNWRLAGAKVDLDHINMSMQCLMKTIISLMETIEREGKRYE